MALTKLQRNVARSLLIARPGTLPGTRVILDDQSRKDWYDKVTSAMQSNRVKDADIGEFCDVAGVPD